MKRADGPREFKLMHQVLCITSIDLSKKTLYGFVELHILPLNPNLSKVKINSRQCQVYRVSVKGTGFSKWLEASFQLSDGAKNVCHEGKKRNLDYFCTSWQNIVSSMEPSEGGGELTIKLPKEAAPLAAAGRFIRISLEFVMANPKGGIHFAVPDGEGSLAERGAHVYSYNYGNSSRLWFPCIDSYHDVCTWKIDFTVHKALTAVCPGELQEKILSHDEQKVTYRYIITTPTSAPNIGFAVGPFETYIDPNMTDVTNFCLPGLFPLLKNSVSYLSEIFYFFEENLNSRYPYNSYKQVFVDEASADFQTFASMSIFSTNLLHSSRIIDQTILTRTALAQALSEQFFGCFVVMNSWNDYWLPLGISQYLCGLFIKKVFGNNEYRHKIYQEMETLCLYEVDGPGIPPLFPVPLAADPRQNAPASEGQPPSHQALLSGITKHHPHLVSPKQIALLKTKAHLVIRMVDSRVSQDLLLQALNKVLSLANTAAAANHSEHMTWNNLLISTHGFLKTIASVSGKDINTVMDQWICHSGITKFMGNFSFNRKRNIVELDISQEIGKGYQKYVGPLVVSIQELDGSFTHTVQVEDIVSHHELPCHSKSRRNKKKKIPLVTGEEVDMDLNQTIDTDSPVLWIRIDPDMTWMRKVSLEQPDYMWQYQLRYERDVTSQIEAAKALQKFPSMQSKSALLDIVCQQECFYRVRTIASECLVRILSDDPDAFEGEDSLINCFQKLFGSQSCPSLPKFNDFSNFISYFVQKEIPVNMTKYRNSNYQCPMKILQFILDLIKYNDNRYNKFSDGYYKSCLIDSLTNAVTSAVTMVATDSDGKQLVPAQQDAQLILGEVVRHLNLEKLLPTYRFSVTQSCLKTIRALQVNGHIPAESAFFKSYARYGMFIDVRKVAIDCLVDFVRVESSDSDLRFLLDLVKADSVYEVKYHVLRSLQLSPPFTRKSDSSLNSLWLVERLWEILNIYSAYDYQLRCETIELYNCLYGRVTPSCVPSQGLGVVIDLRERTATSNMSPLPGTASPGIYPGYEEGTIGRKAQKRKQPSQTASPLPDHIDSPMNMESSLAAGNKLKLKIKLGGDDGSGPESGAETQSPMMTQDLASSGLTEDQLAKKIKKKKKKKHKHKERKERDFDSDRLGRLSTDGSVPPSPFDNFL